MLQNAREYLGLTQEDVAKLMGVSRAIITNIEAGIRKVSAEELSKFSKIYGWTMEELMEGEKQRMFQCLQELLTNCQKRIKMKF